MSLGQVRVSEHRFRPETSGQRRGLRRDDGRLVAALRRLPRLRRVAAAVHRFCIVLILLLQLDDGSMAFRGL